MRQTSSHARAVAGQSSLRITALAAASLIASLAANSALAFEVDTGNPDLTLRWDNTIRYNYATRVENRNDLIGNNQLADEGDYAYDQGDAVSNRLDILSELDLVYMKRYGARLSGDAWYDGAYRSHGRANPKFAAISSYPGSAYSDYTQRLYQGPSSDLLDAFVFGGFDLGSVPVQVKAGRHTVYWGESLLLGGNLHSVAYAQNPLDLQKGFATPGVEAKELFRPLDQISAQAQLTDTLSFSGQYFLDWESFRYPEGGTYLGPVDFAFNGPERQFLGAAGFAHNGGPLPTKQHGDWGLSTRWSPEWLDGTIGVYYRNFTDKLPQVLLTKVGPASTSQYNSIYASGVSLYGLSFAKNILGTSVGAEISYRHNTPLTAAVLGAAPGIPAPGETNGPRGNTMHGLVNAVGVIPSTPLFDSASWVTELTFSRWLDVTSGQNLFNALGYAPCLANGTTRPHDLDKWDGCATKNYAGLGAGFTPTWFAVLPGLDLTMPLTYAVGLKGNAATTFGGNQGNGNYSYGFGADLWQKYRFELKYVDFVGHFRDNGTQVTSANGLTTYLKDRGFVSLTFKTTF